MGPLRELILLLTIFNFLFKLPSIQTVQQSHLLKGELITLFFLHRGSIISTKVFSSFVIANFTGVPKEKKKKKHAAVKLTILIKSC